MAQQPFYGKLASTTPSNSSITIVFGDTTVGSNEITNVAAVNANYDINLLKVGAELRTNGGTFGGATPIITAINGTTITVNINATSASRSPYFQDLPEGLYFVKSASFTDPNVDYTVNDITGSNDSSFEGPTWSILGVAARISNGNPIKGRFHEYKITDVVYRDLANNKISFYLEWNESGVESDSGDTLYRGNNQNLPIVTLTPSESLAPIFSTNISGLSDLYAGSNFAGYQILIDDYLDNLVLTDIYYTGSEVLINTQQMNFSGSGVEVTPSGSDGVLVNIKNDTLTSFYTGSEVLTEPTNKINFTGSGVEVESSGSDGILVTIDGGGSGGTYTNTDPTPINFPSDDDPNIPSGTTFTNKTFPEMMDLMLYPELDPTLTNPSNTFSISPSGLREIGETIATITLSATFNKGSISPAYGTTGFRSGDPNNYVYTGTGATDNASTALTDTETVSSYTVLQGSNSWTGAVAYNAGPQPLTSKGNNFSSPLSAGTTSAITRTITGVYPAFATTSAIGTLTKQSLQSMTTYIQVSMVAETGGNKQTIDIPVAWSAITGLQQFNTFSGTWDSINLSQFSITSVTNTIQGNPINYKRYTHNSNTIGARQLRFTV
jgi:hypothetical protein